MSELAGHEVTRLLADLSSGVDGAADRLAPLVYDELHRIAVLAIRCSSS
jgi:hypothetical protein